jgi:hypothetical protein
MNMKKSIQCAVLACAMLVGSVSTAFGAVGYYTSKTASISSSGVVASGKSFNKVSDMSTKWDVTYRHNAWGYSTTQADWAASSGKTGAMRPYYLYVKSKVLYCSFHLPAVWVYGSATAETANSGAYTASFVRAPSNANYVLNGWCDGGIPRYAYTSGTHKFRYNASATVYTWTTYEEIRNPNFP